MMMQRHLGWRDTQLMVYTYARLCPNHTQTHGILPCLGGDPLSITYIPEPLQDEAEAVLRATYFLA